MEQLILIIVSLGLGFWQGLKKRNKKAKKEVMELNTTIGELKRKLEKQKRKNRLQQFSTSKREKAGKDKLEIDLVQYSTLNEENYDIVLKMYSLLDFIAKTSSLFDLEKCINEQELHHDIDAYIDDSIVDNDIVDVLVQFKNGKRFVPMEKCYDCLKKFENEIILDEYDITLKEFIEVLNFVLFYLEDEE